MKALVEQLADEGEFKNDQAIHAVTLHLMAVSHYEKQDKKEKVIKHMKGFKILIDHQKKDGLISDDAYDTLKSDADVLIEKWNALVIVKDGQAHAVVVASPTSNEGKIPEWTLRGNDSSQKITISDSKAYTGHYSLHIHDSGDDTS